MKILKKLLGVSLISFSMSAFSADTWTAAYEISVVDSVVANNYVYLTLDGYSNSACSNHRISLTHPEKAKFDQMFSMVLSAFHSGTKVRFYFPDNSNCDSYRILLVK